MLSCSVYPKRCVQVRKIGWRRSVYRPQFQNQEKTRRYAPLLTGCLAHSFPYFDLLAHLKLSATASIASAILPRTSGSIFPIPVPSTPERGGRLCPALFRLSNYCWYFSTFDLSRICASHVL